MLYAQHLFNNGSDLQLAWVLRRNENRGTSHDVNSVALKYHGFIGSNEYILFRRFITPLALQLLFWAGIAGTLYETWWLYTHENWAWKMAIIFGPLLTRLLFENFMLRYQTYLCLKEIKDKISV